MKWRPANDRTEGLDAYCSPYNQGASGSRASISS